MNHTDEVLQNYFQAFSAEHDRLKQRLLESLPAMSTVRPAPAWRERIAALRGPVWLKPSLAAAAVLVVLLSIVMFPSARPDAQMAFATSMDNFSQAQSIHLKVQTGPASMEIWWRRPNEYRMVFSDGMTIVSNDQQRIVLNPKDKTFKVTNPDRGSMDMMVLGPFGMLFTSKDAMSAGWVKEQKLINREEVNYKGQNCLKLTFEDGVRHGVYIVEPELHLIYQATLSPIERPDKANYQMEVFEVNSAIPEDVFQIEQPEGYRLIRQTRSNTTAIPALPVMPKK
ncbi:MAG: hypothetical protein JW709_03010 [Sedimentisphaerales bacterium]|nr:hypothetical protein [Sedimentisphaerales bacterium]